MKRFNVQCSRFNEALSLPIVADDVSFHKEFNLIAAVNHTGILDKGHYTAYVKLSHALSWQFCNDAAVLRSFVDKVNNTSSDVYIYNTI